MNQGTEKFRILNGTVPCTGIFTQFSFSRTEDNSHLKWDRTLNGIILNVFHRILLFLKFLSHTFLAIRKHAG